MAYTSTIGLALSAAATEQLKAKVAALPKENRSLLKNADDHRTRKGIHLYYWNCVSKAEQRFLTKFITSLSVSEYNLCRVGDALDDNEQSGSLEDPFDMRITRDVSIG